MDSLSKQIADMAAAIAGGIAGGSVNANGVLTIPEGAIAKTSLSIAKQILNGLGEKTPNP